MVRGPASMIVSAVLRVLARVGQRPLAPRPTDLICSDRLLPGGVHPISVRFGLAHGRDVLVVRRGASYRLITGIVPGIGSWRSFSLGFGPAECLRCDHLAQSRTGRSGRTVRARSVWIRLVRRAHEDWPVRSTHATRVVPTHDNRLLADARHGRSPSAGLTFTPIYLA